MPKVIVIVGPTAVGKTKLSIALAKKCQVEIISGDSMQIYRGMDIGTAKVTPVEMEGVAHHLIDCRHFSENYSVMDFQREVRKEIAKISERGHLPMIVGGTGLYIKAALYDYHFDDQGRDEAFLSRFADMDNAKLHAYLASIDPQSARSIHMNNRRRVLRAIEIYETTGKTKSEQIQTNQQQPLYETLFIGLELEREQLNTRINERVEQMFADGLYDEFCRLVEQGAKPDMQSMKAIGYQELFALKEGQVTLAEAKEQIALHSRRYAKRQMTWFRHQMPVHFLKVDLDCFEHTIAQAEDLVSQFLDEH